MTRTQYRKKCKQLKKNAMQLIDTGIEKALKSGSIDLADYEDNYILPKIVLSAIGHEIAYQFAPHSKEDKKAVENLRLFL